MKLKEPKLVSTRKEEQFDYNINSDEAVNQIQVSIFFENDEFTRLATNPRTNTPERAKLEAYRLVLDKIREIENDKKHGKY